MKLTKRLNKNKKRSMRRGGGFFFNSANENNAVCNINQVNQLTTSEAMHQNYQTCCPKTSMGTKNTSPYCVQLEKNFQNALNKENNVNDDPSAPVPSAQLPQSQYDVAAAQKKPWYKFWGGKKSKGRRNKKKRYSKKNRK